MEAREKAAAANGLPDRGHYLPSGQMVDPQNVLVGDEIKMKVTAEDSNGRLHELSSERMGNRYAAGEATLSSFGRGASRLLRHRALRYTRFL